MSIRSGGATAALVVAVSIALAGCGVPARSPGASSPWILASPSPTSIVSSTPTPLAPPSVADQLTLEQMLTAWAGFPVTASPRPLVLPAGADLVVHSSDFGFSSGDGKLAFFQGEVHPPAAWPANPGEADGYPLISPAAAFAELMPAPGGQHDPPTSAWLDTSAVQLGTATFTTDRGPSQLPAWEFTFGGVSGSDSALAVAPASIYSAPPSLSAPAGTALAVGAELGSDGRTLAVTTTGAKSGTGPCEASYVLQTASSETAVAIVVDEHLHLAGGGACDFPGYFNQVTTTLSAPLGARVVVNATADAVAVTGDGPPG